jgi:predicted outer membrane repeat protein
MKSTESQLKMFLVVPLFSFLVSMTVGASEPAPVQSKSKIPGIPTESVTFVSKAAKGKNDGSSWKDAYTDLKSALEHHKAREIWVAQGVYKPDRGTNSLDSTFKIDSAIALYGGFKGGEHQRSQADPSSNLTILSGDIGRAKDSSDNSNTVVTLVANATINGFHIADGMSRDARAGGMMAEGEFDLGRCVFENNKSSIGPGALSAYRGSPYIHECIFTNNSGQNGGAIYARENPSIANCAFYGNKSDRWGGAILFYAVDQGVLVNSTFHKNSSPKGGALLLAAAEGGIDSKIQISNSIFWDNRYSDGKEPEDAEIYVDQISLDNSVEVRIHTSIIKGGTSPDSAGIRIKEKNRTYTEFFAIKAADPLFLLKKPSGLKGRDGRLFTRDDGLNVSRESPATDMGSAIPDLKVDLTGQSRIREKKTDIGAYEN